MVLRRTGESSAGSWGGWKDRGRGGGCRDGQGGGRCEVPRRQEGPDCEPGHRGPVWPPGCRFALVSLWDLVPTVPPNPCPSPVQKLYVCFAQGRGCLPPSGWGLSASAGPSKPVTGAPSPLWPYRIHTRHVTQDEVRSGPDTGWASPGGSPSLPVGHRPIFQARGLTRQGAASELAGRCPWPRYCRV